LIGTTKGPEMKRNESLLKLLSPVLIILVSFGFQITVRAQGKNSNLDSAAPEKQARLIVQLGHSSSVISVRFSPDGKYVLTSRGNRNNMASLAANLIESLAEAIKVFR
jgi:hypothetical protein